MECQARWRPLQIDRPEALALAGASNRLLLQQAAWQCDCWKYTLCHGHAGGVCVCVFFFLHDQKSETLGSL